jgi:death on curing protein
MPDPEPGPRWVARLVIVAIHADMLSAHGGLVGVRDKGALESAMARPRQRREFGDDPDLASLATAYAYGITRNHPYIDGNKRTAFVTMAVFLALNGLHLVAEEREVVTTMLALASGDLAEDGLAAWLRGHLQPRA